MREKNISDRQNDMQLWNARRSTKEWISTGERGIWMGGETLEAALSWGRFCMADGSLDSMLFAVGEPVKILNGKID